MLQLNLQNFHFPVLGTILGNHSFFFNDRSSVKFFEKLFNLYGNEIVNV
jgi:hypothetical protein